MTIDQIIEQALLEDSPRGDITTEYVGAHEQIGSAKLIAKEDLVLSGKELFTKVFLKVDPNIQLDWFFDDSELIVHRQTVCVLKGKAASLLKAERVALNFLGHLSGIATLTRCYVEETKGTKCKILDTRKTTPLLREIEKQAVVHGGGKNHRINLSDAILVKENHIHAAGGIENAVNNIRANCQLPIEVEVQNYAEAKIAAQLKVERIMLDNMSTEEMRKVAEQFGSQLELEASGNMSVERIEEVAAAGVHFISVGAITHSAPCADFSLLFI